MCYWRTGWPAPNTGILAPNAYEGKQIDIRGTCTGPFEVVEEVKEQSLRLERNDNYWGGTPTLATAEVRYMADGDLRATQLQTGEVDIAQALPVVSMADLEGNDDVEVTATEVPRTTAMMINNSRPPFNDPLVRQAIQKAIDTQAIADSIYEGVMAPAVGPFSPEQPWAPEGASPVTQDLEEARRLFDEAGVDPSTLSFQLMDYVSRPELPDVATVIQDQLGELGIEVKIKTGEYEPDVLCAGPCVTRVIGMGGSHRPTLLVMITGWIVVVLAFHDPRICGAWRQPRRSRGRGSTIRAGRCLDELARLGATRRRKTDLVTVTWAAARAIVPASG